jgi:molybdopterin/thiamine biosynthesis adenylyltransferase
MAHVIVVGAGAIGSHLLPHLARLSPISRLTVIDHDRYDASNTRGQDIDMRDVGRPKALVQARRLRRINPRLEVVALRAAVERVPLGALRGAVILAALDSRKARMVVNQAAWRLGVPWIDSGIHADGMLARVRVYAPADDAPCLECAWEQEDYDAVEQRYPCAQQSRMHASTGAPSALGALAAALQAAECERVLQGDESAPLAGREVLLDVRRHTHAVTSYRRNPACRMPDHAGWRIGTLDTSPDLSTVGEVLALGSTLRGATASLAFGIAGQRLVTALRCDGCEAVRPTCQTERLARTSRPCCPLCGGRLGSTGFDLRTFAPVSSVPAELRQCRLSDIGVRPHDVLTLRTPETDLHLEVSTT